MSYIKTFKLNCNGLGFKVPSYYIILMCNCILSSLIIRLQKNHHFKIIGCGMDINILKLDLPKVLYENVDEVEELGDMRDGFCDK